MADLFARHERALMKCCLHLAGNREAACDLFQDAVCRLLVARPEIRADFRGYAKVTAARLWINRRKRDRGVRLVGIGPDPSGSVDTVARLEAAESRGLLVEALERLDDRTRLCVVLRLAEAYKLREIGRILGVSEARCKQLTDKGLQSLRQFFQSRGDYA